MATKATISSSDVNYERHYHGLRDSDPDAVIYVYLLDARYRTIKPYAHKTYVGKFSSQSNPDTRFLEWLRDTLGGGYYRILIRHGREMLCRCDVGIG